MFLSTIYRFLSRHRSQLQRRSTWSNIMTIQRILFVHIRNRMLVPMLYANVNLNAVDRYCSTNIKKLQRVQTSAARAVLPNLSQQPATALLSEPNWLPVNSRITFKLACLAYNYSSTVNLLICARYYTITPRTLRSTNHFFLDVPRFSTEFGKRSFNYLAPTVWNGLPLNIRLSPTFNTFKRRLKTHLFK